MISRKIGTCSHSHAKYFVSFQPPAISAAAQVSIAAWKCHLPPRSPWPLMGTTIPMDWGGKEPGGKKVERVSTGRKVELLFQ